MGNKAYAKLYDDAKRIYFNIGEVTSTSLNGDKVVFNRFGWRHIFQKRSDRRSIQDTIRRFTLLKYAPKIVREGSLKVFRENIQNEVKGRFWTICSQKQGQEKIKVIIRQINDGPKHFFSVMD